MAQKRFVSPSTDKCLPFLKTLRKEEKVEWTDKCEKAFTYMKQYLASAPLLVKPNLREILYLYLMVFKNAVSSALVKEEGEKQHPV